MMAARAFSLSRRLLLGTILFGLFVLFDIALLSWLIFDSLSENEIQRVVSETKTEAQELANQLADQAQREGRNLYTAVALEIETQTYIDSILSQRDTVTKVEIWDNNGTLVFRSERHVTDSAPDLHVGESPEFPTQIETKKVERETPYETVTVPVGEVGSFVIGISRVELDKRLGVLRGELIRQAGLIGILTVLLFLTAYFLILGLIRRSQKLAGQAKEAERMAYIGTLASGLAHEIRSPLNSLNLNMQMLEEEINQQCDAMSGPRLLAITRSEIHRLERLVTDFLSYARPRALEIEEVRAVELLEHTKEVLAGQVQAHGARVEIEDRSLGASVDVDRAQMSQLLLNLAQNALSATEGTRTPPLIQLSVECQGQNVVLAVTDNGVGMSAEEKERVFDLFYSNRKGGTGLGLAIVDRIARAHGGRLEIESRPGAGTTVRLYLRAALSRVRAGSYRTVPESLVPAAGGRQ